MDSYNYGTAYAVVFEKRTDCKAEVRDSLRAIGFGDVELVASRDELERALHVRVPDLFFCGCDEADDEICDLLRAIRDGALTSNPFLVILVATRHMGSESVSKFRNAGADAVLGYPVSSHGLSAIVGQQIQSRKKFVATSDYIGPDRRRDPSRSGDECFEVLNSLRLKCVLPTSEEAEERIAKDLALSLVRLNAERRRQNVVRLCVLWRLLEQRRAGAPDFLDTLHQMQGICRDVESRISEPNGDAVRNCCEAVQEAIVALEGCLRADSGIMGKNRPDVYLAIEQLGRAALRLADIFVPGRLVPSKLFELDELVAKVDIRRCRNAALSTGLGMDQPLRPEPSA